MKDFNDKNDDELEDFFNSIFNNMFKKGFLRESSFASLYISFHFS